MGFRADVRAACVALLEDYRTDRQMADPDYNLQVYGGRPKSIHPPHAFIDRISDPIGTEGYTGPTLIQRRPTVEIVVVHGIWDGADAMAKADEFTDGFIEWQRTRMHQASANSTIGVVDVDDEPTFTPTWLPEAFQKQYFATRLVVEGFTST